MAVMVLPIDDDNSHIRRFPLISWGILVLNVVAFLWETVQGGALERQLLPYLVIPAQLSGAVPIVGTPAIPEWLTVFTSIFLHGGWAHLIGNMAFFRIFSDNVEDQMGHIPYLIFYLLCGVAGTLLYVVANPASQVPMLGASGAISGVMASYLILHPNNRVSVLWGYSVADVPAYAVVGMWALTQILLGAFSLFPHGENGGVAYLAHVGGFVAGLLLTPMFTLARRNEE